MIENNYLSSAHMFNEDEKLLAFQFKFFNIMLALAVCLSPFIAYIHREVNTTLFYSDMLFSFTSFLLILLLRQDKKYFSLASSIFIPSLFITITLVFFIGGDDPTKVVWAPIFFACAFLLQGGVNGLFWLFSVLVSYLLGYYFLDEQSLGYSFSELMLISIAFITVSVIFNAFKDKNDADNEAMMSVNSSLKQKTQELEGFSVELERRIKKGLKESENKTNAIQHNLNIINKHVLTVNIDLHGLVTNVSQAYCQLSGYKKNKFIGKPFTVLFDPSTPTLELKDVWKELQDEKEYHSEIKNFNSKDNSYWLNMHISPEYTATNEFIGYIGIAHNISDKKLVLQQQEQLIAQSRHAAMGEMISMIAHQWRQPLGTISAITTNINMDLKLGQLEVETLGDRMESISKQVQHLSHTVDDFRDFFKPTTGLENTYVYKLMKEATKLLDHRLANKVTVIYEKKIDICLALYHNELIQVLINILNNACDAFEENKIESPVIRINESIQNEYIIIEITDNAGGIEEQILKHIFDPYFSTKTKNGTGLGLYMSKTIVEDHQKGLLAVFNVDKGAMFRISLPISACKF